jgi:hypothetical protein
MFGRLQWLEQEIERLRMELYQTVSADPFRLTDTHVLGQSQQLDKRMVEWTQIKQQKVFPTHSFQVTNID